jgi:hypothetical protein
VTEEIPGRMGLEYRTMDGKVSYSYAVSLAMYAFGDVPPGGGCC